MQDTAFIAIAIAIAIAADPEQTRAGLSEAGIELLRLLGPQVNDARSSMWQQLDAAQRQVAQATYEFLVA